MQNCGVEQNPFSMQVERFLLSYGVVLV